jgi:uncharacterized protein
VRVLFVEFRTFETTAPDAWDPARLPIVGTPESRPGHPGSVVTDWSVDPEEYGYFLCKVWDEWLRRDVGTVLVNFCETLVVQRMGEPARICIYGENCGKGLAVEHDGSSACRPPGTSPSASDPPAPANVP